jgi:hypothetical protein
MTKDKLFSDVTGEIQALTPVLSQHSSQPKYNYDPQSRKCLPSVDFTLTRSESAGSPIESSTTITYSSDLHLDENNKGLKTRLPLQNDYESAVSENVKVRTIPIIFNQDANMVSNSVNGFHGYKKNRVERFFVSGIRKSLTEAGMREYLQVRNVHPTFIKFFSNPNFSTMSAQMNVPSNECKHLINRSFWPWGIRIRKWISRNSFYPRKDNGFKE